MSYRIIKIEIGDWETFINRKGILGVFGNTKFLTKTANSYNFNLDIRVVVFNDKPVLAIPLFAKKNKIVCPNHYFYQFIWQKENCKEVWSQLEAFDFLLKVLKDDYKKITLRLPTNINDVRPFLWNGFQIDIKYTYEKDLNDLTYNRNLNRILNKYHKQYSFRKNCDWQISYDFHHKDLEKLGLKTNLIRSYMIYLKGLEDNNQLEVYNAYYNDNFITSIITIVDNELKLAYFAFMGSVDDLHYKAGLPTLLYDYALKELKENNFINSDFLGANIKEISKYKSKFLPVLQHFYVCSYSENKYKRDEIVLRIKKVLKKFIS